MDSSSFYAPKLRSISNEMLIKKLTMDVPGVYALSLSRHHLKLAVNDRSPWESTIIRKGRIDPALVTE